MTDEMSYDAKPTSALTAEVAQMLVARGWRLTTAESCTGAIWRRRSVLRRIPRRFMIPASSLSAMKPNETCCRFVRKPWRYTAPSAKRASRRCRPVFWQWLTPISPSPSAATRDRRAGKMVPCRHWYGLPWNFRGQTETKRMCFAGDCETVVAKAVRYALAALSEKLAHWQ